MNYADWYTDTVDIWRTTSAKDGSLTVNERTQVAWGVPCRVYLSNDRAVNMTQTAADLQQEDKLACANSVDIRTGDELYIYRGGGLKKGVAASRAFAGEAHYYFEPFGAVIPGLAHQEIRLLHHERVK